ncbi:anti-sigma factor [Roseivivax sp. CAU 1761]
MNAGRDSEDDLPGGDDALAAEYALGLLTPEETDAFEARILKDRALEARVVAWTESLALLGRDVPAVVPPAALRRRIEDAAWGREARPGLWRQILPYGLGGAAAALLLWAALGLGWLQPAAPGPALVAELALAEGGLHAGYYPETRELLIRRRGLAPPAEGDLELWVIAGDGPPVSLGLVPRDAETVRRALPAAVAALLPDAVVAVSLEPPGGAPGGAPTGPVLGRADVTAYTGT